jgi:hypothetical protein
VRARLGDRCWGWRADVHHWNQQEGSNDHPTESNILDQKHNLDLKVTRVCKGDMICDVCYYSTWKRSLRAKELLVWMLFSIKWDIHLRLWNPDILSNGNSGRWWTWRRWMKIEVFLNGWSAR